MDVALLLVADFANIDQLGKLNIFGVFGRILARGFPTKQPMMHLILKLGVELGETAETRTLSIRFADQDGQELWVFTQNFEVPKTEAGQQPEVNILLELRDFLFPKPGRYEFKVYIDKDYKASLPIDAALTPQNLE